MKWISRKECMPEPYQHVLVYRPLDRGEKPQYNSVFRVVYCYDKNEGWRILFPDLVGSVIKDVKNSNLPVELGFNIDNERITHWAELPEQPTDTHFKACIIWDYNEWPQSSYRTIKCVENCPLKPKE